MCAYSNDAHYECEISFGGEADLSRLYETCDRNQHHTGFYPASSFLKEHLPEECCDDDVFDLVKTLSDLTTRIVVAHVSQHRPEKWPGREGDSSSYPFHAFSDTPDCIRTGTGFVESVQEMFYPVHGLCPCPKCSKSEAQSEQCWWKVRVNVATHVLFDATEARSAVVDCFFDSEEHRETQMKTLYGLHVGENPARVRNDWNVLVCATHDKVLVDRLCHLILRRKKIFEREFKMESRGGKVIVISHPHGCSKMISVGSLHSVTIPAGTDELDKTTRFTSEVVCRLPPSSAVLSRSSTFSRNTRDISRSLHCNINVMGNPYPGSSIELAPHTEFILPEGTGFSIPSNASFARMIKSGSTGYTFPPRTQFFLPDGREFNLPPETKISGATLYDMIGSLTYTNNTCPGSSGACVLLLGPILSRPNQVFQIFTHSCTTSSGLKKSALGFFRDKLKQY